MTAVDNFAHVAEEERKQQCANVRTVDIGIGHDDDAVVTQAVNIEGIFDTHAKRLNHAEDFVVGEHFVQARALNVQHLTTKWQNCLGFAVTSRLRRTTSGVTLHQVQFRSLWVLA